MPGRTRMMSDARSSRRVVDAICRAILGRFAIRHRRCDQPMQIPRPQRGEGRLRVAIPLRKTHCFAGRAVVPAVVPAFDALDADDIGTKSPSIAAHIGPAMKRPCRRRVCPREPAIRGLQPRVEDGLALPRKGADAFRRSRPCGIRQTLASAPPFERVANGPRISSLRPRWWPGGSDLVDDGGDAGRLGIGDAVDRPERLLRVDLFTQDRGSLGFALMDLGR